MAHEPRRSRAADYAWSGWPTPDPKLHVHDGLTVEIRPGRPELAVYQGGRLCENHRTVAGQVVAYGGSLRALASVAVYLGEATPNPALIAQAIREAERVGGERPKGVPADAQLLELPCSEACMHLRVADRLRWVAPVDGDLAQIYDEHGRPYSIPILRGEAGFALAPAAVAPRASVLIGA